jgi:DNA-binding transcriptional ArsR family regulator
MEEWRRNFLDAVKAVTWSQWAALGAYVGVDPCRRVLVDPEALVVGTCALGRDDARIFDEALDWILVNHRCLKPWRLKHVARSFGPEVQRILGACLDFAARTTGEDILPGVRKEAREALAETAVEELFYREKGRFAPGGKTADPLFLEWKLLRGKPRIRKHAASPDLENPANLLLRLREYYGSDARAEVTAYLLLEGEGSSNAIAARVKYRQGRVYRVLESMVEAGLVYKRGGPGPARYRLDREKMAAALGLGRDLPAFFDWSDVLLAFHLVISDWWKHEDEYAVEFLALERSRLLLQEIIPLLSDAARPLSGIPAPRPETLQGEGFRSALQDYLLRTIEIIRNYSLS